MSDFISILISAIVQLIAFLLIPFLWWVISRKRSIKDNTYIEEDDFFSWIGLKRPVINGAIIKVCIVIGSTAIAYIVLMYLVMSNMIDTTQTANSQFLGKGISALPSILIYGIIQTGLSEELFFRGFLCKRLTNKFGFVVGNSLQALCFGLLHGIPFGLVTGKLSVCIVLTILPGTIGYIQGWLNEKKANGSIVPSWTLHSIMNILSALSSI